MGLAVASPVGRVGSEFTCVGGLEGVKGICCRWKPLGNSVGEVGGISSPVWQPTAIMRPRPIIKMRRIIRIIWR
jgi:hypothetical protein